jgi:hypothetical protein
MDRDLLVSARPYVFDYVVGILWVVSTAMLFVHFDHVVGLAKALNTVASSAARIALPDFAVGFMLIVAGVIIPYCITAAMRPFNILIMNFLLTVQRGIFKRRPRARLVVIRRSADAAIAKIASFQSPARGDAKLHFLTLRAQPIAANLKATREGIDFRAALVMPVSLFFGAVVFRALDGHSWPILTAAIAVLIAGVAYAAGVWVANSDLAHYKESVDLAVLIAAALSTTPEKAG